MRILRIGVLVVAIVSVVLAMYFFIREMGMANAPTITCSVDSVIEAPTDVTDEKLLSYVVAFDDEDGDLSDKIIVERKTYLISEATTLVTFSVCDSDDNVTKIERKLHFVNYYKPKIKMLTDLILPAGESSNIASCFRVDDSFDGDITDKLKLISADYSDMINGSYELNCKVTNSLGDTRDITITAIVTDDEYNGAKIILSDYLVYLGKSEFESTDKMSYVEKVKNKKGYEYSADDIKTEVEQTADNVYNVFYTITDGDEVMAKTRLVVVIEED